MLTARCEVRASREERKRCGGMNSAGAGVLLTPSGASRPRRRFCPLALLPLLPRAVMLGRMSEVTRILSAIEQGDPRAAEQLLPLVYDELRRLAAQRLA